MPLQSCSSNGLCAALTCKHGCQNKNTCATHAGIVFQASVIPLQNDPFNARTMAEQGTLIKNSLSFSQEGTNNTRDLMKLVPEFLVCIYGQYFLHAHNLLGNKCLFFLVWEFVIMLIICYTGCIIL